MYREHQPKIQHFAERSPENFARVGTFVLATIRQPIERVPESMRDIARNGAESRSLYGSKRDGYLYLQANAERIQVESTTHHLNGDDIALALSLLQVPGLGLVKAGFLAQLAFGRIGCLDTHNMKRFDLDRNAFRTGGLAASTLIARTRLYVETCRLCGGSEKLWDSWCRYVAALRPSNFAQGGLFDENNHETAAEYVSWLHLEALGLA